MNTPEDRAEENHPDTLAFLAGIAVMPDAPEGQYWKWVLCNNGEFWWGLATKKDPDRKQKSPEPRMHRCGDDGECVHCCPYIRNDPSDGFLKDLSRA